MEYKGPTYNFFSRKLGRLDKTFCILTKQNLYSGKQDNRIGVYFAAGTEEIIWY